MHHLKSAEKERQTYGSYSHCEHRRLSDALLDHCAPCAPHAPPLPLALLWIRPYVEI